MPGETVQLRIWLNYNTEREDEELVSELISNHGFVISNTWQPGLDDLEYQTQAFADTESNEKTVQKLKSALATEFPNATVTLSSDNGSHHIRDKPYSGVYNMKIENG